MSYYIRAAALMLLGSAVAVPAAAQEVEVNAAKCFLVSNVFAKMGNDKEKPVAREAAVFYLARLNGSSADVQRQLLEQLKTITNKNNGPIMSACAKAMNARVLEVNAAQKALAETHRK
jgi:hypothetical protein